MRIGILGAGHIGSALARHLIALGHEVKLANSRGAETLRELAAQLGAQAASVEEAARDAELLVVTIPMKAVATLSKPLFAGLGSDVTIIDTNNYYPSRDGRIEALEAGQLESAWVAEQLGRPVIKAFNNIFAASFAANAKPKGSPKRLALSVAGDPQAAREKVLRLVDDIGFDPVDTGPLAESWRQQPGTPCYCKDFGAAEMRAALAQADRARIAEYRAQADEAARPYFLAERQKQK